MTYLRYAICVIFFVANAAFAETNDTNSLANVLNSVQTMQANFTQKIYDSRSKKIIQQSSGTMSMQRPGRFRWGMLKPIPQLIIANQSRLWIYDPDLEQVTIRSLSKVTGETPALLLSHVNVVLDQDYKVKMLPSQSGKARYELIPKNADNMFASVQLGFVDNHIQEMQLKDHLGHTTTIQFTNIKVNMPIPASQFTFKAPSKNIDVIDETRKRR